MNKVLRSSAVILAGVVAAVSFVAAPAQAGGYACKNTSNGSTPRSGTVCLRVRGSGVMVNDTDNTFTQLTSQSVCNRRAWNSGYQSRTDAWSYTSSIHYGCVAVQSTISLALDRKVFDPSYFSSQFQANGGWIPALPRVLLTS